MLMTGGIDCQFAIRGGGHTPNVGSANIDGGITLDMSSLATVTLTSRADQLVTSVGAGARWRDVYRILDSRNLTVAGGRDGSVGVAGLTLGGDGPAG